MTESGTLERDRLAITRGMERAVALLRESGRDGRMANPARCVDVFDNCQTTPIFAGLGDTGHHRSKSGTLEGWRAEFPMAMGRWWRSGTVSNRRRSEWGKSPNPRGLRCRGGSDDL